MYNIGLCYSCNKPEHSGACTLNTADLTGALTDRGYNMTTASGLPFWPADPRPEDVRIEDIAAHLSRLCRFNGAIRDDVEIYSVAQHSVLVSEHVPAGYELEGLLHDAAEAYIGDRIKPLKMLMPGYDEFEYRIDRVIRAKFGLPLEKSQAVRDADYRAVLTERRDILPPNLTVDWGTALADPWPEHIHRWQIHHSRSVFLHRFKELTRG